jgi:DNA-binding CsgD family transcriptional regulator
VTETFEADRDEFASWCERRDLARRIFERLSPREQEIAALAADGLSSRECADRLRISMKTVEKHRLSAYRRLDVPGLAGLIRIYIEAGFPGMNLASSDESDTVNAAANDSAE